MLFRSTSSSVAREAVTVISEAMGKVLWPGRDPIGQCIRVAIGNQAAIDAAPCTTVVGVAENAAQENVSDDPRYMFYLPMDQVAVDGLSTMLIRMSDADATGSVEYVRRELTRRMPGDGFVVVRALQAIVDDHSRSWRLGATLFVAFGGLAFIVAVVGLYGLVSYSVEGRMHELGVRASLGARPSALIALVVRQGVRFAVFGVAVGLGLALLGARWIEPLLFRQSATDPVMYATVAAMMVVVAVVASIAPAWRAARADPCVALRVE